MRTTLRHVFEEIVRLDVPDDGVRFDVGSLEVGLGDAITPAAEMANSLTLTRRSTTLPGLPAAPSLCQDEAQRNFPSREPTPGPVRL